MKGELTSLTSLGDELLDSFGEPLDVPPWEDLGVLGDPCLGALVEPPETKAPPEMSEWPSAKSESRCATGLLGFVKPSIDNSEILGSLSSLKESWLCAECECRDMIEKESAEKCEEAKLLGVLKNKSKNKSPRTLR